MEARKNWKLTVVLTVLAIFAIVGIFSIVDDFQADEAQRAKKECKSDTAKCDPNAYCYGNDTSYECICMFGWDGDGLVGDGHSGCQRRQLSKSRLTAYIIEIILAALVILWFLVDVILSCIRLRARIQNNSQVALAQQGYPHQEVAPGSAEAV